MRGGVPLLIIELRSRLRECLTASMAALQASSRLTHYFIIRAAGLRLRY